MVNFVLGMVTGAAFAVAGMALLVAPPMTDHRNRLLLLDWEGEAPSSTGPLPYGPSVYHSAIKCAARENQPCGLGWVKALTAAAVEAHTEARYPPPS